MCSCLGCLRHKHSGANGVNEGRNSALVAFAKLRVHESARSGVPFSNLHKGSPPLPRSQPLSNFE